MTKALTDRQLAKLDRLESEVGIDSDALGRFQDEILKQYDALRERLRLAEEMCLAASRASTIIDDGSYQKAKMAWYTARGKVK